MELKRRRLAAACTLPILAVCACIPKDARPAPDVAPRARALSRGWAGTGFEDVDAGAIDALETRAGTWRADPGHAVIDGARAKSGSQCLHIVGGEARRVLFEPAVAGAEIDEISFWAERWTQRDPFVFRVDAREGDRWREIYAGDGEIRIGSFPNHVRVPVDGAVDELRMTCTSPSGVLIDEVRFGRRGPMEVLTAEVVQPVVPILVGRPSVATTIRIDASGRAEPLLVEAIELNLEGTSELDGVSSLRVRCGDQATAPIRPAATGVRVDGPLALREGLNEIDVELTLAAAADVDGFVAVSCSSLRLSDGSTIAPTGSDPVVARRLGIALRDAGDDGAAVYRIPAITTTTRGTLIAVYDVRWRGWADLPADVDVGMSRSTDGGRSWEPMRIIAHMGDDPEQRYDGVGDPAILVDETTGTIWVAAIWSHGDRGWNGSGPGLAPEETGQLVLLSSDDDGLTWSQPRSITSDVKRPEWAFLLQGPGRGICMRDGTLVFAAQYRDTPENGRVPHSTILSSRDHGATWQLGTGAKSNTTEAQVVELEDGVLMLNMRDNRRGDEGGARSVAITRDLGRTWSEHPTSRRALVEPVCNAALLLAGGDTLLFANPAVAHPPRRDMTLKASLDLGETWPQALAVLLDEGRSAGYPSMTMVDERTVGLLYESSRAHLVFQRIPLDAVTRP